MKINNDPLRQKVWDGVLDAETNNRFWTKLADIESSDEWWYKVFTAVFGTLTFALPLIFRPENSKKAKWI